MNLAMTPVVGQTIQARAPTWSSQVLGWSSVSGFSGLSGSAGESLSSISTLFPGLLGSLGVSSMLTLFPLLSGLGLSISMLLPGLVF